MQRIEQPEVTRDRWDRPVIDGKTYVRPSQLAKALDDQSGLIAWKSRMTAVGLGRSPDLVALAATTDAADSRKLNDIVERATDRAGATGGRDTGTAIHSATELVDYGEPLDGLPADLRRDALAYAAARESLEPLAAEVFVVNDMIDAAGTFDRLMLADGVPTVTDIKTGSKDDPAYAARFSGVPWAIQLAIYAHAEPYGTTWMDLGGVPSLNTGVIWYIPRGTGRCYPITVDLVKGWELAKTARAVYDARKANVVLHIGEVVEA